MISRRPLAAAALLSTLLHAALVLVVVDSTKTQPLELTLTATSSKIQAVVVSTLLPQISGIAAPKEPLSRESVSEIEVARAPRAGSTPAALTNRDVYLLQEYLTRQPRPESELSLEDIPQPDEAGVFQIRIWIDHSGKTVHIDTDETTAPKRFIDQITERFKATRFVPGERHGVPVACVVRIEISY